MKFRVLLIALYVLASPVYFVVLLFRVVQTVRSHRRLRDGEITCPSCESKNALDALASCRRCRAVEFGSLLFCSRCELVATDIACGTCGASIRVI